MNNFPDIAGARVQFESETLKTDYAHVAHGLREIHERPRGWKFNLLLLWSLLASLARWLIRALVVGPIIGLLLGACAFVIFLPVALIGVPITMFLEALGVPEELSGLLSMIPAVGIAALALHWLQPFFKRCHRAIRAFRRLPMPGHWEWDSSGFNPVWVED
jgi:hypothetical protein